jgi:hypothetical protein
MPALSPQQQADRSRLALVSIIRITRFYQGCWGRVHLVRGCDSWGDEKLSISRCRPGFLVTGLLFIGSYLDVRRFRRIRGNDLRPRDRLS